MGIVPYWSDEYQSHYKEQEDLWMEGIHEEVMNEHPDIEVDGEEYCEIVAQKKHRDCEEAAKFRNENAYDEGEF